MFYVRYGTLAVQHGDQSLWDDSAVDDIPELLKPFGAFTQPSTAFQGPSGTRSGAAGILKLGPRSTSLAATRTTQGEFCGTLCAWNN
eukprot:scaffold66848_cov46-Prasinocladus_malaysianus.AAC.1